MQYWMHAKNFYCYFRYVPASVNHSEGVPCGGAFMLQQVSVCCGRYRYVMLLCVLRVFRGGSPSLWFMKVVLISSGLKWPSLSLVNWVPQCPQFTHYTRGLLHALTTHTLACMHARTHPHLHAHTVHLLCFCLIGRVRSNTSEADNSHALSLNALNPHMFKRENDERYAADRCVLCSTFTADFISTPLYRIHYQFQATWDSSLHNSKLLNRWACAVWYFCCTYCDMLLQDNSEWRICFLNTFCIHWS